MDGKSLFGSWFAGPVEITIFTALILSMVALLVWGYFHFKKKEKREHSQKMTDRYNHLMATLKLDKDEKKLIEKMELTLDEKDLRYHMLTDIRVFKAITKKITHNRSHAESLMRKLKFSDLLTKQSFRRSGELPLGMPLLVTTPEGDLEGTIESNGEYLMRLEITRGDITLCKDQPLTLYIHDFGKVMSFSSTVLSISGKMLELSQSLLEEEKRRRYRRRSLRLPVTLKTEKGDLAYSTYMMDLSQGGASVENPSILFKKEDRLILTHHSSGVEDLNIEGRVVKLSSKGKRLHIRFFRGDEASRLTIRKIIR